VRKKEEEKENQWLRQDWMFWKFFFGQNDQKNRLLFNPPVSPLVSECVLLGSKTYG